MTVCIKLNICVEVVNNMDKSRQQFEDRFKNYSTLDKDDIFKIDSESNDYYYLATRQAWFWWQASREILEIEFPDEQKVLDRYEIGFNNAVNRFKDVLISNGVKIKNGTL